jgi:hypothetical protein
MIDPDSNGHKIEISKLKKSLGLIDPIFLQENYLEFFGGKKFVSVGEYRLMLAGNRQGDYCPIDDVFGVLGGRDGDFDVLRVDRFFGGVGGDCISVGEAER